MTLRFQWLWRFGREILSELVDAKTPRLGAALAYYTVFAVAPLFLIALHIAGVFFGPDAARHQLFGQLQGLLGADESKAIEAIVSAAANKPHTGIVATSLATITLLVATTGVFVELQDSLNTIWRVKNPQTSGVWTFVRNRLLSFAMVMGIGFLLLVSLVLNAGLSAVGDFASGIYTGTHLFWLATNFLVSLGVITVLFTMILKVLPSVEIEWRFAWLGGSATALLFNIGKIFIGIYLGRSAVVSAYGAAGSLIIVLLWVYYSAQILFFGAVLTRVVAIHSGSIIAADAGNQNPSRAKKPHGNANGRPKKSNATYEPKR